MDDTLKDNSITEEELSQCDGQDNHPTYVAYNGKVYDVTASRLWAEGVHQSRHSAGKDLMPDLVNAPHDETVLQRVTMVGRLVKTPIKELNPLLDLYLKLHPHPIVVPFPIALILVTAGFLVSYLVSDIEALVNSAFYVFITAVVISPITILTGISSWWFNYQHKLTRIFIGKASLSVVLFVIAVATAILWGINRNALIAGEAIGWVYFALVLFMSVLVVSLGKLGGELIFPSRGRGRSKG